MKARYLTVVGLAAALTVAGCSSSSGGGTNTPAPTNNNTAAAQPSTASAQPSTAPSGPSTDSGTLTVWLMTGDFNDDVTAAVNAEFAKQYPNVKVDVETQQWGGIAAKITTALGSDSPPDVLEIGNTDVPEFASSGGLADLTSLKGGFENSDQWLAGLEAPATINGKLYGIPELAGDRVVVYNKKMFADAGITAAPTSLDELKSDAQKLKAKNSASDFSALYLPGMYWYAGLPMVWDNGGDIATNDGGKWTGSLSSDASQKGLAEFKELQNDFSTKASQTVNTNKPDQDSVMGTGKAAMIIAGSWEPGAVVKDSNGALTADDLGSFCFPSVNAGQCAPVFLGGSDLAISQGSKHQAWAVAWTKIMTGQVGQAELVKAGLLPNSKNLLSSLGASSPNKAWFDAAASSKGTPASPGWAKIESDSTMENLFSQVASGSKSPADAAAAADSHLNDVLNASS